MLNIFPSCSTCGADWVREGMKAYITVDILEGYMSASKTAGGLVNSTIVMMNEMVWPIVATGRDNAALTGWVIEVAVVAAKCGDIVRLVEI